MDRAIDRTHNYTVDSGGGGALWFIFLPLRVLIGFAGFVLWLFCMCKAYSGGCYQLPVVGELPRS